ncbi:NAD(P)-dependent oxidoreductase [Microbacterium oleivorans]|uniref:NAD(P)-dependent oxidoreductase n=1 Tax=Microbacterium oleivorans TaxID=273677 RepID=UPI0020412014|nr:NAD(P)-dependent oxidoreductase [Microbacterium oleivorans]MCM3694839.1 hydroxyacid dehydrogenase [Microbacterium oleivorans]
MTGRVLVTSRSFGGGGRDVVGELTAAGYEIVRADPSHDLGELSRILPAVDGWIAGTGPVTGRHLDLAPRLRVVSRYGVGVDNVDVAAAGARGVIVTNTPGANSAAVAEHTLALLLSALRGIPAADRRVRRGDWSGWSTRELSALTVGVLGLGRIGRLVIERLDGFGCAVRGADPWVPEDDPVFDRVVRCDAAELAVTCDVVTLHAPGGRTVVDRDWLAASDRPVILVNTARADLVDEPALADAIRSGRVVAYAADTLATENHGDLASPLLADDLADRVIITPHLGAQTREGVDGMGGMATADLRAVLEGRAPRHPVSA